MMASAIYAAVTLLAVQGSSFRIGFAFDANWPAMGDEEGYAELLQEGGVDFQLDNTAWTGGIEALGDLNENVRIRGAVTTTRFRGAYSDNYEPGGYILAGILTGGLLFLFDTDEDVVALVDESTNIQISGYYKLTADPSLSVGGGPYLALVNRSITTPNTDSSESATGVGFTVAARLDQESGGFLGLPIVFGLEGGYRGCSVKFDGEYQDDFTVDFSGPYIGLGTYLKF